MMARERWNPWWVVLSALVLAALLLGRGHPNGMRESMVLSITVIPPDASNLDCSGDQRFGDIHCAYDAQGRPLAGTNPLRPYVTIGRELILLSGIFEDPAVNGWLQAARHVGSSERVTLECKATTLGKLQTIAVRWQNGAAWGQEHNVPAAKVQGCTVSH
jgi:hypothetical protein